MLRSRARSLCAVARALPRNPEFSGELLPLLGEMRTLSLVRSVRPRCSLPALRNFPAIVVTQTAAS